MELHQQGDDHCSRHPQCSAQIRRHLGTSPRSRRSSPLRAKTLLLISVKTALCQGRLIAEAVHRTKGRPDGEDEIFALEAAIGGSKSPSSPGGSRLSLARPLQEIGPPMLARSLPRQRTHKQPQLMGGCEQPTPVWLPAASVPSRQAIQRRGLRGEYVADRPQIFARANRRGTLAVGLAALTLCAHVQIRLLPGIRAQLRSPRVRHSPPISKHGQGRRCRQVSARSSRS